MVRLHGKVLLMMVMLLLLLLMLLEFFWGSGKRISFSGTFVSSSLAYRFSGHFGVVCFALDRRADVSVVASEKL
jgi:hypothetical protein